MLVLYRLESEFINKDLDHKKNYDEENVFQVDFNDLIIYPFT